MSIQQNLQPSASQNIKVQLLLAGGHQYTVYLNSDTTILHSLLTIIAARAYKQESASSKLFQIPINEGHAVLCFSSDQLVGVVTEPPVWLQQVDNTNNNNSIDSNILNSHYIQIDNFLSSSEHEQLIQYVLARKSHFIPTSTSTSDENYRRSMVLYSFPEFHELIINKIKNIVPDITSKLNIPSFNISQIEGQITAHNDGNYYKIHNDNGSPDTAKRELTYVYYFYQEPKRFSGGELLIYDSKIENNYYVQAESYKTVEPRNNSIVFFLSRYMHEVLPVSCPSQDFADSRFTVNGWVHR
ncbi:2OG-Fe(II) oxygenase [Aliinostoc sp. HNIBRCY26]|uniref:2OG-Fe(II) oxygenase n=1 Tax=Aliinostoc sp. HNIBRCY26 TaxID=3418997 RepID=UPI003D0804CD